ncbi:hypothetical protein GZ78_13205 [Endozoicomonas numazuensis]|uniref:Uncharacterized protein n=2 Tax=Endozoicomonas numazuensis TaxID=1137799 RepID=A0A081NJ19_9GAMM|nr:hypothetical protein GZ78_13205 [Endozoicomonas numazuensis]
MCRCFWLTALLMVFAPSVSAGILEWCRNHNPFCWWNNYLFIDDHLGGEIYQPQGNESSPEQLAIHMSESLQLFDSLEPELRQMFMDSGITPELMQTVLGENGEAAARLSQVLKELGNIQPREQLNHHRVIANIIRVMCLFGGAVNRIAAYTGLAALFSAWGAPVTLATAMAGLITGGAMLSSNFLSVEGANKIRFEGIHSIGELCCAVVSGMATAIDCGMAYRGMEALTGSVAAGLCTIPFMVAGLYPLLLNKLIDLSFSIYGKSAEDEILLRDTVQMLADVMHTMERNNCSMDSNVHDRMNAYFECLGMCRKPTYKDLLLDGLSIHGKVSKRKNTLKKLHDDGYLQPGEVNERWTIPERVFHRAEASRRSSRATVATRGLLILSVGPALVYVFGDTSSLTQLVEDELSLQAFCGNTGEQAAYWIYQGGALAAMSGKSAAAARNGARNLERLMLWLYSFYTREGEQTPKGDIAANLVGFIASLFYGANNFGTMAGNIMGNTCLGEGTVAFYMVPSASAVGGIGFNGGCGKQLKKGVIETVRDVIQIFTGKARCQSNFDEQVAALYQLDKTGIVDLSSKDSLDELKTFLEEEGFVVSPAAGQTETAIDVDALFEMLHLEMDESTELLPDNNQPMNPATAQEESDNSLPVQMSQEDWLLSVGLPAHLGGLFSTVDYDEARKRRVEWQWLKKYLLLLADILERRRSKVHTVPRGVQSFFQAYLESQGENDQFHQALVLRNNLVDFLYHLIDPSSQKSDWEQRFIRRFGRWRLLQIARDLVHGDVDLPLMQLLVVMERKTILVLVHRNGKPVLYRIAEDNPEQLEEVPETFMDGNTTLVVNGMGQWAWLTTGGQVSIQMEEEAGLETSFSWASPPDPHHSPVIPQANITAPFIPDEGSGALDGGDGAPPEVVVVTDEEARRNNIDPDGEDYDSEIDRIKHGFGPTSKRDYEPDPGGGGGNRVMTLMQSYPTLNSLELLKQMPNVAVALKLFMQMKLK